MGKIEIRDNRESGWFWVDNAVLLEYLPKIGQTAFIVYCALAMHANKCNQCWPSYNTLAKELNLTRQAVISNIKKLAQFGLISIRKQKTEDAGNEVNKYELLKVTPSKPPLTTLVNPDLPPSQPKITTPSKPPLTTLVNPDLPKPCKSKEEEIRKEEKEINKEKEEISEQPSVVASSISDFSNSFSEQKETIENPVEEKAQPEKSTAKPKQRKEKTPLTTLPRPFNLTPAMQEWAKSRCPLVDAKHETEKFVNWALSNAIKKADWDATWKNWLIRTQEGLETKTPITVKPKTETPKPTNSKWKKPYCNSVEEMERREKLAGECKETTTT